MWSLVMYSNYMDWNMCGDCIGLQEAALSSAFKGMFVFTAVSLHYK